MANVKFAGYECSEEEKEYIRSKLEEKDVKRIKELEAEYGGSFGEGYYTFTPYQMSYDGIDEMLEIGVIIEVSPVWQGYYWEQCRLSIQLSVDNLKVLIYALIQRVNFCLQNFSFRCRQTILLIPLLRQFTLESIYF